MTIAPTSSVSPDPAMYMVPTSFAQQRLWFLDQLEPQSAAYNIPASLRLNIALNVGALEQSFNALVQRHEVLRTTFVAVDGQPMQVIAPALELPLPLVDLSTLSNAEREAEALRLASEQAQRPFDLTQGPLLRVLLLQLAAEEYVLLLTIHHIISDGWSIGLFFQELAALYTAFASSQPLPLPDLPIQYADFALWQQERVQRDLLADDLVYWKQQLAGASASLDLPTDRPPPVVLTYRGSVHLLMLPSSLTEALKALGRREGVTLHMMLVAAFQTLLYRYSGQDDMVLGTVTAGRGQAELEPLIGFFVNTLVLRTDLSGNPTFREVLGRVREVTLEAYAHQEVPFDYLVRELHPTRSLGQNPLFQVMLVLQPPPPALLSQWERSQMVVDTGTAKFDLSLDLADQPEGLVCRFEYSIALFDAATIARMAGHWQTLLEGIIVNPSQHLSELPLLTEKERHLLLVEWNETGEIYADACFSQLFEEQVEHSPGAFALVYEHEQWTYRQLNARANQLAHALKERGVGPEVMVGLCLERSPDLLIGLLGILKAGGAYVPLDPQAPADRLAFQLTDTQIPILLTQQRLLARLPAYSGQVLCLDRDWSPLISQYGEHNPPSCVQAENLAYVIYTSGSTGQPKGVLIPHRALAAHCLTITQVYGLGPQDRVLQFSTYTFDASLEQMLPALLVGAQLVLRGPELWTAAQLLSHLKADGLTVVNLPPAYWQQVLHEWVQTPAVMQSHCLRLLIVGGDQVPPAALHLWRQLPLREVRLLNAYGPTETTITATLFEMSAQWMQEGNWERVPIGRPLPNRTIYLLDRAANPVPVGVAGEVHIGGALLARGYLNRADLTAERFIPDPFGSQPGGGLYKTGDLARYLPDGTIEFLGRTDLQVKIRGFRIELGEIETVLELHPAVREAVVVAREHASGDKRLVAYIVAVHGQTPSIKDLRSLLKEKLPEYMLPSAFILLDALPLTPNGKVDRRALPAPEPTRSAIEDTFVPPTLSVHYQLLQIWEELLDVRPIGIRDDFFDLGGHSFLATNLISRIEHVFRKKISLATLFAGPTIEHLADALQQQEEIVSGPPSPLVAVQAGGTKRPFFFLHGDYLNGAFYCFPLARNLGPDQPFYALEPYQFDVLGVPPTLEVMAAAHLESLRSIQPAGPYLLGGFCNGGLIAYEMARQLHAQGEAVDLLILMNPSPVGHRRLTRRIVNRLGKLLRLDQEKQVYWFLWLRHLHRYLQHAYRYLRFPRYRKLKTRLDGKPGDQNGMVLMTLKSEYDLWLQGAECLGSDEQRKPERKGKGVGFTLPRLHDLFPEALFPPVEALRQDWAGIFAWVMSEYEPGFYPGKSTFFFTKDSQEHSEDVKLGKVAEAKDQEVEVYAIAGMHDTCKTIYLHDMAEHLRMCLNKVQAAEPIGVR